MTHFCKLPGKDVSSIILTMEVLDIDVLIGKNLRRIRKRLNLSQSQFAEAIGTTPQRLSAYETGRDGMGKDYMERICNKYDIRPWEFYLEDDTPVISESIEKDLNYTIRKAEKLGVAEDIVKYSRFLVQEAKRQKKKEKPPTG